MSPLALLLLRRVTIYALLIAVLLMVVPRALTTLGVIGPTLDEEIEGVSRSIEAAVHYGAPPEQPFLVRAQAELQRGRELMLRHERFQAKRSLRRAHEAAVEAQRSALANREESRRAAQKIVNEMDRLVNELEDLYGQVTKGLDKKESARLFGLMKIARQKAGALVLSFEEQSYAKVVAGEKETKDVLANTKAELLAARTRRSSAP